MSAAFHDRAPTPRRRHPTPRHPTSPTRYLRRAGLLLLLTWLPAVLGAIGLKQMIVWAAAAGYLGLSWLLPGILVVAAVRDWTRGRGIPYPSAAGIIAGTASALALLLASAILIGLEFPRFRGHLSAWPVWVGREDGVHVQAEVLPSAVSGRVSS